jgi:hypothetical protein
MIFNKKKDVICQENAGPIISGFIAIYQGGEGLENKR